ncbi:hypothetical protein LCGC14_2451650 [marine sediment metagenome]|uniref:Uncharacterized protein n=1 Tax=marine sediment metagenome TaxID=412755 RepID=A0A0F9C3H6_9ZZZZ
MSNTASVINELSPVPGQFNVVRQAISILKPVEQDITHQMVAADAEAADYRLLLAADCAKNGCAHLLRGFINQGVGRGIGLGGYIEDR